MLEEYKEVLTIEDICKILGVGRNLAYKMLQNEEIFARKIRHKYIIPKQSVVNYLTAISQGAYRQSCLEKIG